MAKRAAQSKRTKRSSRRRFSLKWWLLKWAFVIGMWGGMIGMVMLIYCMHDLPDIDKMADDVRTPRIKILARDDSVITSIGSLKGKEISYDQFPKVLIDAVVSTEDRRFFHHYGVDPIGLLRAFYVNSQAGRVVQGGSTITQQLAKVMFLSPERTFKRKIQEVVLALSLEHKFTKEEIITMYLNRIYMGDGNYGMDAASKAYFNTNIRWVTLYQAAMLAGMIKAPSRYAPTHALERAKERANQVILNMVDNGVLDPGKVKMHDLASQVAVAKVDRGRPQYFSDWIKEQLPDYIGNMEEDITVHTTFDPALQHKAEEILEKRLAAAHEPNQVQQGAAVIMTPQGDVLAMVGGTSYEGSQFNRVTQAFRQPGSAFKMFVYLAAMEAGYTPDDHMVDAPVTIDGWSPNNWNHKYVGDVTLRDALANSINTVAVKLAKRVGIDRVIDKAKALGISTPIGRNLTSVLGASEVTLLDLTGAYAHIANNGDAVWVHGINEISADNGNLIYRRQSSHLGQVITPQAVAYMNDMLMSVVENGTGKHAKLEDRQAAGKTGTSQSARDGWFIGYTPDFVVGVWVGNDNNMPMKNVGGGGLPAMIWHDIMNAIDDDVSAKEIPTSWYEVDRKANKDSIWEGILSGFGSDDAPPPSGKVEYTYPHH